MAMEEEKKLEWQTETGELANKYAADLERIQKEHPNMLYDRAMQLMVLAFNAKRMAEHPTERPEFIAFPPSLR